jgi:hypothetical protein
MEARAVLGIAPHYHKSRSGSQKTLIKKKNVPISPPSIRWSFVVFPYIALTVFVVSYSYRYITDLFDWNSKSSELLDKEILRFGITL